MLSVSIFSLFILSLIRYSGSQLKQEIKLFFQFMPLWSLGLFFIMVFVSGVNSSYLPEWLHQLKMKLPYLVIPFSLWVFRDLVVIYYKLFHQIFVGLIALSTIIVLGQMMIDYDAVVDLLSKGRAISTPVDHIKYSIFVCFSVIVCFVMAFEEMSQHEFKIPKWAYLSMCIYLFLFLHLMAVRSGLFLCYFILTLAILNQIRIVKKYILLVPIFLLIIGTPILAYNFIPSFYAKMGYMRFDLTKFNRGEGKNYSDSERIYSIMAGIKLFKENPLLGTGIGDLRIESGKLMEDQLGKKSDKYPHNQFVYTLAGMGLLGFLFFLMAYFSSWTLFAAKKWLFIFLALLILFSFLVENTLERSYSIAFFCFFYGAGILRSSEKSKLLG